jgi:hypothetical protein
MSGLRQREQPRPEKIPWKGLGCEPVEVAIDLRNMPSHRKLQSCGGTEIDPGSIGHENRHKKTLMAHKSYAVLPTDATVRPRSRLCPGYYTRGLQARCHWFAYRSNERKS